MGRNPGKAKKRVKPNTKIRHPQDRAKNYLLTALTPRTASSNDCRRHKFHLATLSSLLSKVEICMYPNIHQPREFVPLQMKSALIGVTCEGESQWSENVTIQHLQYFNVYLCREKKRTFSPVASHFPKHARAMIAKRIFQQTHGAC